jgi:hypothetical protein
VGGSARRVVGLAPRLGGSRRVARLAVADQLAAREVVWCVDAAAQFCQLIAAIAAPQGQDTLRPRLSGAEEMRSRPERSRFVREGECRNYIAAV